LYKGDICGVKQKEEQWGEPESLECLMVARWRLAAWQDLQVDEWIARALCDAEVTWCPVSLGRGLLEYLV
jgi:hypothetical protein